MTEYWLLEQDETRPDEMLYFSPLLLYGLGTTRTCHDS